MRRLAVALALALAATAAPATAADYHAPRNAWGQPDLQGVWNTNFVLPLEAPPDTPQLVVSEAEAKTIAARLIQDASTFASLAIDGEVADLRQSAQMAGLGVVRGQRRTRQVVEPADGKVPFTPAARRQVQAIERVLRVSGDPPLPTDGPEVRPDWERCVVGQGQPPIAIVTDINPRQILQTRDTVVLLTEYGPDLRIIPLSDQHGGPAQASALGDAIAHWEGETLVIETISMPAKDTVRPLPTLLVPKSAKVIERYTRVGPNELLYQYTVVDPAVYSAPWLAEYSLYRTTKPLLEFACHEGNYSLPNILSGARAREREARAAR